jgi:hypothetical protein
MRCEELGWQVGFVALSQLDVFLLMTLDSHVMLGKLHGPLSHSQAWPKNLENLALTASLQVVKPNGDGRSRTGRSPGNKGRT